MEAPFGPAAGPHTQLAQNLIAAYAAGSRFFELKTVQTLDGEDLPVAKPCINAQDECYNVEWSTELRVPEAYDEYVKAWFALKLLSREWGLGSPDGFIFNMSVGYDLEGIKSPKIDAFIEGLKNAENTPVWAECRAWALEHLGRLPEARRRAMSKRSPPGCAPRSPSRPCTAARRRRSSGSRPTCMTEKGLNTYHQVQPDPARLRVRARDARRARVRLYRVRRPPLQGGPAVRGRGPDDRAAAARSPTGGGWRSASS